MIKQWYAVAQIESGVITYIGTSDLFTAIALLPGTCYAVAGNARDAMMNAYAQCQRFRDRGWTPLKKVRHAKPFPSYKLKRIAEWNQ